MGMFDQPRGMFAVDDRDTSSLGGILMDYLRNVMSGQVAAGGVLGQNFYDPNRSFAQNALDPRAIEGATDIAMGVSGGGLGIKAYHGSPYDFDKFDLAKIGTGEGAQAYGHGLYFSESPAVAQSYRDKLAPKPAMNDPIGNAYDLLKNYGMTKPHLIEELENMAVYSPHDPAKQKFYRDTIEAIRSGAVDKYKPPGKMYEVDINARPEQFLDWDKPLSQQPHVQSAFNNLGVTPGPRWELLPNSSLMSGASRLSPEEASAALQKQGIPGIKYLDQGSRGAGQGTSNYVVFDPSIIEILRKYGILGPVAVPGTLAPFMGDQQQ